MPTKTTQAGIDTHLHTLTATPARIAELTQTMDESALGLRPAPGVWSALEHRAYLRAGSEVWTHSIYMMIMLDAPELPFIHPRVWMKKMGYARLTFADNFAAYAIERQNLIRLLSGLPFEGWNRTCRFTGKDNTFTIFGEALRMAFHEIDHLPQIEALSQSR